MLMTVALDPKRLLKLKANPIFFIASYKDITYYMISKFSKGYNFTNIIFQCVLIYCLALQLSVRMVMEMCFY